MKSTEIGTITTTANETYLLLMPPIMGTPMYWTEWLPNWTSDVDYWVKQHVPLDATCQWLPAAACILQSMWKRCTKAHESASIVQFGLYTDVKEAYVLDFEEWVATTHPEIGLSDGWSQGLYKIPAVVATIDAKSRAEALLRQFWEWHTLKYMLQEGWLLECGFRDQDMEMGSPLDVSCLSLLFFFCCFVIGPVQMALTSILPPAMGGGVFQYIRSPERVPSVGRFRCGTYGFVWLWVRKGCVDASFPLRSFHTIVLCFAGQKVCV